MRPSPARVRNVTKTLTRRPLNMETSLSVLEENLTPTGAFYVRSHFKTPTIDGSRWRLRVEGEVGTPLELSLKDLKSMRQTTLTATLECAGNGRKQFARAAAGETPWGDGAVGNATWTGVRLSDILELARPQKDATYIVTRGADHASTAPNPPVLTPIQLKQGLHYVRVLPMSKAMEPDTILATRMNGRRLSTLHGYPARLLVPGWYAMASVKWPQAIRVGSGPPPRTFFNDTKYVYLDRHIHGAEKEKSPESIPVTEIRVKSLITRPRENQTLEVGKRTNIRGKAWSGHARINCVEVRRDGRWEKACIENSGHERYSWVCWNLDWTPRRRGINLIQARASDDSGATQPFRPMENAYQYGANAIHTVRVRVV